MKTQVTLEAKEVRAIIAGFLGLPVEKVTPLRYGYAVEDMTAEEIGRRLGGKEQDG